MEMPSVRERKRRPRIVARQGKSPGGLVAGLAGVLVVVAIAGSVVGLLIILDKLGIDESAITVIAVVASTVVAVRSLDVQRAAERERALGERRAKLVAAYRDVYESALAGVTPSEEKMREFNVDLTFYGDEDMIKAWLIMRQVSAAADGTPQPTDILPASMGFVRAMRKDLGHKDRTLTDMDLFSVILADPAAFQEELRKAGKA